MWILKEGHSRQREQVERSTIRLDIFKEQQEDQ